MTATPPDLAAILRSNPDLAALLDRFAEIALPDAWIVAGSLAQTVWNHRFGLPPRHGIGDIDLVYFDPDLSEAAEEAHAQRLRARFAGIAAWIDVKNQARVHHWYEQKFGRPLAPYRSTPAAIATYPTTATCIGVRMSGPEMEICAPFGLDDLMSGIVRPNRTLVTETVYAAKAARWRTAWPNLTILPWQT